MCRIHKKTQQRLKTSLCSSSFGLYGDSKNTHETTHEAQNEARGCDLGVATRPREPLKGGPASHQEAFWGAGLIVAVSVGCLWGAGGHAKVAQDLPIDCQTKANDYLGLSFVPHDLNLPFCKCARRPGER